MLIDKKGFVEYRNLVFLDFFKHSFRILSVFQKEALIISFLYCIVFFIFNKLTNFLFLSVVPIFFIFFINFLILITKKKYLKDSLKII